MLRARTLSLCAVLVSTACTTRGAGPGATPMLELGRELTDLFYREELAPIWTRSAGDLRTELRSLQGLADFRAKVRDVAGEEVGLVEERVFDNEGVRYYLRTATFAKLEGPVHVQWGLDAEDRIVDFFIRPAEPAAEVTYRTVAVLRLPFEGRWIVGAGGRTLEQNHHNLDYSNRFAVDFARAEDARFALGSIHANEAFATWGQPILAPAAGTVLRAVDGIPDNAPGQQNEAARMGNHVSIDHGTGEFSVLGHLRRGSLEVRVGDRVAAGQRVGAAGNSGASTGPHLHYNLQTVAEPNRGTGLPAQFVGYCADGEPVERGEPEQGQIVEVGCAPES